MKKIVLLEALFILLYFGSAFPQKTWTGIGGNSLWTTASNWSGNSVPAASDDIILDNSHVSGSYMVIIPVNGFGECRSIKIGYPGNTNTITLLFESNSVKGGGGNPPGFAFGDGSAGNIDFLIDKGGVFVNASTAISGTNYIVNAGVDDSMRVNNGGKFIHVTDRSFKNPFPDLTTTFEQGSVMEWNVRGSTAFAPDVSGYSFGNLVFAADSTGGTRTYSSPGGGGGLFTIKDTWTVKPGVTLDPWGTDGNIHNILFDGNMSFGTAGVNVNISGNVTVNGSFTTSNSLNSLLTFNGTSVQTIAGTAPITFRGAVVVNNPAGLTIQNNTIFNSTLTLTDGIITTSATSLVTIGAAGSIAGASQNRYINGPLQRTLASVTPTSLVFPIGKGSSFRQVTLTLTQSSAASTEYRCEMFNNAPAARNLASSLDRVSFVRYFTVSKGSGAGLTSAAISINYDTIRIDDGVRNSTNLRIAKDDGAGNWIDLGGDPTAANFVGSIKSSVNFTNFSDFALANNTGGGNKLGGVPPAAPQLVSMANGSVNTSVSPILVWRKPSSARSFRLQISGDSLFTSLVLNDSTITDTSFQAGPLQNETKYYWRVNAKNINGTGPYSEIFSFITIIAAPSVPIPGVPSNGAFNQPVNLVLSWNPVLNAASYHVQVSTDSLFSVLTAEDSTLAVNSFNLNGLQHLTKYYWRVRGKNIGGTGTYSVIFHFTTIVAEPSVPLLISPPDGSTNLPLNLTLKWNLIQGAQVYWVQVSTDSLFSTLLLDDSTLTGDSTVLNGLSNSTSYFWRAAAKNDGGVSIFSDTWKFTTSSLTGIVNSGKTPEVFAVYQNYPNPFNPATIIRYAIPAESKVVLKVYNIIGQEVAELISAIEAPGYYEVNFNATGLASGIYFYSIRAGSFNETRKMILAK